MNTANNPYYPHIWNCTQDELADIRNRLRQEQVRLHETSRLLRRQSHWLREESRLLREAVKVGETS